MAPYATEASLFSGLPRRVELREVVLREGFQSEKTIVPTARKIELARLLFETGVGRVQIGSLFRPDRVPQTADCEEVFAGLHPPQRVTLSVLVPNADGAKRAMGLGVQEWDMMLSVSDRHSRANGNASTFEALDKLEEVARLGREAGVRLNGGMAMALGTPYGEKITVTRLCRIIDRYLGMGVTYLNIADTAGVAGPRGVYETMRALIERYPQVDFGLHLHDTRGFGLANALAGMQAGVFRFDSAAGGLGGCPFSPGAPGNLPTEDLAALCASVGAETGVDLQRLREVCRLLGETFGRPCFGSAFRDQQ